MKRNHPLEMPNICTECGKYRNRGNHEKCSLARKEKAARKRELEREGGQQ